VEKEGCRRSWELGSGEEVGRRFSYGANLQGADRLPGKGWMAILAWRTTKTLF